MSETNHIHSLSPPHSPTFKHPEHLEKLKKGAVICTFYWERVVIVHVFTSK